MITMLRNVLKRSFKLLLMRFVLANHLEREERHCKNLVEDNKTFFQANLHRKQKL
jgi:hypothetical protein